MDERAAQWNDRSAVRDHVRTWLLAVERQADRSVGDAHIYTEEGDWAEVQLFALALAQLRRVCAMATPYSPDAVGDMVAQFDTAVPGVVMMRDIVTHIDQYDRGEGKLQPARNQNPLVSTLLPRWYSNDGNTTVLHVDSLALDVRSAAEAARTLAASVLTVLE